MTVDVVHARFALQTAAKNSAVSSDVATRGALDRAALRFARTVLSAAGGGASESALVVINSAINRSFSVSGGS